MSSLDPAQFAALENNVVSHIPAHGRSLADVIATLHHVPASDVKAAVLGLKASGRVRIDDSGTLFKVQTTTLEYIRPALNCGFYNQPTSQLCARCGSPMYLHAHRGKSITDLGWIHGEHPAWVELMSLSASAPE